LIGFVAESEAQRLSTVMPALVAGIHVFTAKTKSWMAGTIPAMTVETQAGHDE
jgi:hypothetical protein